MEIVASPKAKKFSFDAAKAKQEFEDRGRWINIEGYEGSRLHVRHGQNPDFQRAVQEGERRFRRIGNIKPKKDLTNDQWRVVLTEAAPGNLVDDWDSIEANGATFPFTAENCKQLLGLRAIWEQVWRAATEQDEDDTDFREEAVGKS